jgi:FtsH-binding integral membrane protein
VNRAVAALCAVAAAIFAILAALILFTKLTSPSVRAVLYVAAFGVASFACYRTATRLWRDGSRDIKS